MTLRDLVFVVLIAGLLPFFINCTDEDASREALRKSGYSNVQITGYKPFQCGKDDTYSTGFVATNPSGARVEGTVCCGILKSCTVRF